MDSKGLSADEQIEIACLTSVGTSCRGLELLSMAKNEIHSLREQVKAQKEWVKVLERRIDNGNVY